MMEPLNQQERRQAFEQRLAASSERPDPSEIANEPGVSERTIIRDETSTGNTPTTSTPPGPTLTGLELPFVGRSAELDQLETMWQRTANRNGGLALITGESGSGKTRLLREFRSGLDHNHIRTASFKWSGSGTHVPLHTVIESIASNLKVAIPTTLVAQRFRSAHQDASSTITDHLDARVRYYSTLIEWLCDLSAEQPLLLVFDDFHNADSNAMQFFGLAGDRLVNSRCLMVVATRPQFDRDHLDSDVVLSEITLNSGVLRIDLPPLDERSVETIASSALGRQATADELHDVARNTGGNPLLAFEYARHLGTGAKSSHSKRPGDVVVERWRHIDPQTRVVLSYAALKTRPFGPGEIQELGVPTSEWGVRVLLDKAAQQGVLRKLSRTTEIYVFVHDLFSEHFRRILPARESQRIHAHLAASSTDPSGHQINNVQLARHLLEAGDRIPASDRVRVYRDAGWDLIDDHDYYEAHSFFERAAALMGDLRNEVSASIVHGLATSSLAIKPLVEREATHSLVIDAIDRFIELGQTDAALTLSLTSLTDSGGIDHRQIEIYRRGLEIAPPDSIEKALLHARLGRALAVCSGNWNEATVEFNEAERIAVSVDNPEVEVSVLADWVEATDWTGVRDLSGTLAQRCLELNKSVRSARAEYQSYLHLSELAAFESRPVEGLSLAHACLSAAERIPLSSCVIGGLVQVASHLIELGRISEATRQLTRAIELDPSDTRPVRTMVKALALSGKYEQADGMIALLRQVAESDPPGATIARRQFVLACADRVVMTGTFDLANDISNVVQKMSITPGRPAVSTGVAELGTAISVALGESEVSAQEFLADRPGLTENPFINRLLQGMILVRAGDTPAAIQVIEQYTSEAELNASPASALIGHSHLVRLNTDQELSQAHHLERIADIERRTELKLPTSSPGNVLPTTTDPFEVYKLSEREGDALSLISRGTTNREIADRLAVSVNTMQTHTGKLLAKLVGSNRMEAAGLSTTTGVTRNSQQP